MHIKQTHIHTKVKTMVKSIQCTIKCTNLTKPPVLVDHDKRININIQQFNTWYTCNRCGEPKVGVLIKASL